MRREIGLISAPFLRHTSSHGWSFFKARPGYKMVISDYSQQEARIIAGLSRDEKAIELFKAGQDIYLEVTQAFVGDSGKDCTDFRKVAKTIVLGLNYGRSEYSIHQELIGKGIQLSLDEVRSFTVSYYRMFEGVFKWRRASVAEARAKKQVRTKIGRIIHIPDDATDRSLFNLPVQTNGADGFKLALICISEKLNNMDARIVHSQHDEIIVEAREDQADQVREIMKESMEAAFKQIVPEVSFVVEPRVEDVWV
jgi:DNA polymerase-1